MRQVELVEKVLKYDPHADESLLNRAYVYAMQAHGKQVRASGEPYITHPHEVAAILADLQLDDATIATALLHDVIEDTETTKAEIDDLFGPEIGGLVEGLTKIKKLDLASKKAQQAENFRKLLVAISADIRVLLVKLADRLHNMRTLDHVKPSKRARIAEETMEIYAPLAGRMGMQGLREELEDLAFRTLQPEAYRAIIAQLEAMRSDGQAIVGAVRQAIAQQLTDAGIEAQVSGREKKPYAIWRKQQNKQIGFEQLSDIYGFRAIVDTVETCYRVLYVVHTRWRWVPGRFKDYISNPKPNDYRSLHTTIIGPERKRVELQIRTRSMHQIAEYGVAAHAIYKDTAAHDGMNGKDILRRSDWTKESNAYRWLRVLVEDLLAGDNAEEFLEHTKLELFQDQVFCFTPKGRLIALPKGATPIDFAYAVHTDVGNSCVGAKVNGRGAPLNSPLGNGDEVEILCSAGQKPPLAWEKIAVTGKARSAIRRFSRETILKQYADVGRQLLERRFAAANVHYSDAKLAEVVGRFTQKNVEDALAAVGRGELGTMDVLRAIHPDAELAEPKRQIITRTDEGWFSLSRVMGLKFRDLSRAGRARPRGADQLPVPIRGMRDGVAVRFAPNCGAVPGDRIVGIMTPGEGITVYPIYADALQAFEDETDRWIDVTWDLDNDNSTRYPTQITVTARNEPGSLAQIAHVIGETGANIDNIKMTHRATDFTDMLVDIEVWDLKHLNSVISGVRGLPVVNAVARVER